MVMVDRLLRIMVRFLALLHSVLPHVVELCTKLLDNESIS